MSPAGQAASCRQLRDWADAAGSGSPRAQAACRTDRRRCRCSSRRVAHRAAAVAGAAARRAVVRPARPGEVRWVRGVADHSVDRRVRGAARYRRVCRSGRYADRVSGWGPCADPPAVRAAALGGQPGPDCLGVRRAHPTAGRPVRHRLEPHRFLRQARYRGDLRQARVGVSRPAPTARARARWDSAGPTAPVGSAGVGGRAPRRRWSSVQITCSDRSSRQRRRCGAAR